MTWAFVFLLSCTLKNRVLSRIRRLRKPKYLISALVGFAYLYSVFLRQSFVHQPQIPRHGVPADPRALILVESAVAFMLMLIVLVQWFFSKERNPLFNEAEVQFLFPAPVTRGTLLNYRIGKAQIGLLFGSFVSVLFLGRGRFFPNSAFAFIAVWATYFFLFLFRIGAQIEKQDLKRRGVRGRQVKISILVLVLFLLIFIAASAPHFYFPPPVGSRITPEDILAWFAQIAETGPIFYVLFPFRMLIHPATAPNLSRFLLRFAPVLLMIGGVYLWIRCSKAGLEESATGPSVREELTAGFADGGRKRVLKARRPPFRLTPDGFAPIGIYWKNLSLIGGPSMKQALPAIAAVAVVSVLIASSPGRQALTVVGSVSAAMAGFLTLMGPVLFRNDLRTDMKYIDLLKGYPVPGWGIVLGEALAPATMLTIFEWLLIMIAAIAFPGFEKYSLNISHRIYVSIAAGLLMPCLGLIGVLVQNTAVLLLPGWVQLGREHQRGVEAMGQRLISGLATVLSLIIAAVPAGILFLLTYLAGYWLIGLAVIPVASFIAAMGLLAEAAIGIFLLGRVFDRFDPANELG